MAPLAYGFEEWCLVLCFRECLCLCVCVHANMFYLCPHMVGGDLGNMNVMCPLFEFKD